MNKIQEKTLYINGCIYSLNDKDDKYKSLSTINDKIAGLWEVADPRYVSLSSFNDYEIIDLKKKTLIPGFIDTHNHILYQAQNLKKVDCSSPTNINISDILRMISDKVKNVKKGEWIEGYGYDDTLLEEQRHPTKIELNSIAPNNPVIIKHISGHVAVVNSLALENAGITNEIEDKEGGEFGRYENGELNGILFEKEATRPVENCLPFFTEKEMDTVLKKTVNEYLSHGITTNTDAAVGKRQGIKELDTHLKMAGKINPMRTHLMIMHDFLKKGSTFSDYTANQLDEYLQNKSNNRVKLDGIKMFQDGSIQGMTGALKEGYFNNSDVCGELYHSQDNLNEEVKDLHERGFRLAIHGNGDRAIESIIEAYEYALKKESIQKKYNKQHRIEHAQMATNKQLEKMKKLNIAASVFINHVYYWGDRHKNIFLGKKRAEKINPLGNMEYRGILFSLHSDCPVTPISPLFSIWCSVNRLTRNGVVLGEEEKIDVNTALKSMTIYGAKMMGIDNITGSIEVNKKADFVVLNNDPFKVDPIELKDIKILSTVIDGKEEYSIE